MTGGWWIHTSPIHTYTYIHRREEWKSKGEDEWVVGKGADVKFDHVRRTERTMGRGKMYFTGKDRDTPYCAAIRRPALPVSRYVYRFILFRRIYIYIFLDFIARLAPRNTPRRGDLLKFYTVPVFTSEMYVKWKPRDGSSLSIWMDGWRGWVDFFS